MTTVTYILKNGSTRDLEVTDGVSLMEAAIRNNINGIDGDCGGSCSCATCHVYIESGTPLPPVTEIEDDLLDGVAAARLPTSRLSCQIVMSKDLAGLVVRIPDRQA